MLWSILLKSLSEMSTEPTKLHKNEFTEQDRLCIWPQCSSSIESRPMSVPMFIYFRLRLGFTGAFFGILSISFSNDSLANLL